MLSSGVVRSLRWLIAVRRNRRTGQDVSRPSATSREVIDVSTCSKVQYETQAAAMAAMRVIAKRCAARGRRQPRRAYPCSGCKCWHLTSG